jgi:ABC-type nitrate/sulfonate/bicarbonate transport system substrate-binding protein
VVTFTDTALYSELYVLNARPEQVKQTPAVIEAMLRALVKAATFIQVNPDEAKRIMQRYTKLDRDVIDGIWRNFVFRPALGPKLIDYWNAEAAWARDTKKVTPETKIPNFRDIVDDRFLRKVKPDAVKF